MSDASAWLSKEKIGEIKFSKTNGQSRLVIFLLFLIPGTPKDILAYGVGLTDLSLAFWIFTVSVGRLPSILLSTLSGDALGDKRYGHFIIVLIIISALAAIGAAFYRRWTKEQQNTAG